MMTPEARAQRDLLLKEICRCVMCEACDGRGEIRYMPFDQFDDETEPCDFCDKGVAEVCDRCRAIEDLEC